MVKIAGELWEAIPWRGSLAKYEGKKVEVAVQDAWATEYIARDIDTLDSVAMLHRVKVA